MNEAKSQPEPVESESVSEESKGQTPEAAIDPLEEARSEAGRMKDMWMRAVAELDNARKRARRDVDDAKTSAREDLLCTLLPVFDNLERAVQSAEQATEVKSVVDGVTMILKQFVDTLGRVGIQRVETIGVSFNPSVHEAIQQIETDEHPAGTVIAEVQPGYRQGERLLRAAMVVVAKAKG